ncbi:MAG: asparagine synthase (glutamine-hydrolyzing) [bacterium]|nr:asparagine synthase (glutamine-hydrolyzing) [bacterium]
MCGIAGVICRPGETVSPLALERAANAMANRGPDDLGYLGWWPDNGGRTRSTRNAGELQGAQAALVHRRLSVLDLSSSAWQPMTSLEGNHHLVFNGEVYNYCELRDELEKLGVEFRSSGDTAVLLEAMRVWNAECLSRLIGMFAFAFVDSRRRAITLARDGFGIKPLFYSEEGNRFIFASSISSLLALAPFEAAADRDRVFDYLRYGLTDHTDRTLFKNVLRLPAGHFLEVDIDNPTSGQPQCFWNLEPTEKADISFEEAARTLRDLFLDSVTLHLRSDVPVGAALSGGIDSSSIVMAMREVSGSSLDLHTVSFHADDPTLCESAWIDVVNQSSGATEHRVDVQVPELINDLDGLITAQEEPFGSTSIYAQYCVFRAASEAGLTVMLDGQGADELLAGYRPFIASRCISLLHKGEWNQALSLARAATTLPGHSMGQLLRVMGSHIVPRSFQATARRLLGRPTAPKWINRNWFVGCDLQSSPYPRAQGEDALRQLLVHTIAKTSLPMLLRFEDRNSMAFSIESRVPFLTPQLAEFVLNLPEQYLLTNDGTSKAVFRAAMTDLVPSEVLDRRDKIGFATPEFSWLQESKSWVDAVLTSDAAQSVLPLRLEHARAEWQGVLQGRRQFDWHIWRWICLIRWAECFDVSFER